MIQWLKKLIGRKDRPTSPETTHQGAAKPRTAGEIRLAQLSEQHILHVVAGIDSAASSSKACPECGKMPQQLGDIGGQVKCPGCEKPKALCQNCRSIRFRCFMQLRRGVCPDCGYNCED